MPVSNLPFEQQYPGLSEAGKNMLRWLNEQPDAPSYNHVTGHRLTAEGLAQVRAFDAEIRTQPAGWTPGTLPDWLDPFIGHCFRDVPFYRRYGARPARFEDIPAFTRSELAERPWAVVPDSLPLDDLIVYGTSGTTGHPIDIPCSPAVSSMYLPLVRAALARYGLTLDGGPGRVACLLICSQKTTFTLTSVNPYLEDAGWAKINLNPADWPTPDSPVRFIDACNPEIFTGDPLAFADLARLSIQIHPKALLSSAMAFPPGLRDALEAHFGCPVIDIYSMTESGPIAALEPPRPGLPRERGYMLLQPRLYVEILDQAGQPCPPGVRGEITLTGGFNPYFPLLRYRTNDYANLAYEGRQPVLVDFQGRPPTLFRTTDGVWINNVDINNALRPFPLERFQLHQFADGSLHLRAEGNVDPQQLRAALIALFGPGQILTIEPFPLEEVDGSKKLHQYTTDLSTPAMG